MWDLLGEDKSLVIVVLSTLPARSSSYELPGEAIGMHSVIEYVGRTTAPDQARSSSATAAGSAAAPLR